LILEYNIDGKGHYLDKNLCYPD